MPKLTVTRRQVTEIEYAELGAFRLRVDAADATGDTDPNVFLYNRRPVNPYDNSVVDDFVSIASVVDLAEYPVGQPNETTTYPMFRLSYMELDFRSIDHLNQAWGIIVSQLDSLMKLLIKLENLQVVEVVDIGTDTNHHSASSSTSA